MEDSPPTTKPVAVAPTEPPTAAAAPASSSTIEFNGQKYNVIKEGLAHILNPPAQEAASKATRRDLKTEDESQTVFYNPIQQFNRDLSVIAIRAFSDHVSDSKRLKSDLKAKRRPSAAGGSAAPGQKGQKRKREGEDDSEQAHKKGADDTEKPDGEIEQSAPTTGSGSGSAAAAPAAPATPTFTILDALSATGLRALRYASEIPHATKIIGNDLSPSAISSMKTNITYNNLDSLIRPNLGDARAYMYTIPPTEKFDVIDLDPYGTAAPFLDAAVQAVKDGGLLCVTCTDAGVWASTGYAEKAFALYGGVPIKGSHSHEGGLRLILNGLAMAAAKYGLAIEPLLSLSIDFYARTFVRIARSPAKVKFVAGNTLIQYNCDSGCGAWSNQYIANTKHKLDKKGNPMSYHSLAQGPSAEPHCEHCGFKTHLAGPMWGGKLHNPAFIKRILAILPTLDTEVYQTIPRIEGMLTTALEEDLDWVDETQPEAAQPEAKTESGSAESESAASYPNIIPPMDPSHRDPYPFYFTLGALSKSLHCSTPPIDSFRGAIASIGYRSTRSHCKPNSIRTDAPWNVIWEIMREWVRQHAPVKNGAIKKGTPGAGLMRWDRSGAGHVSGQGEAAGTGATDEAGAGDAKVAVDDDLETLKTSLQNDINSGKDVSDLITKIEASLYRVGKQQQQKKQQSEKQGTAGTAAGAPLSSLDITFDAQLGKDSTSRKRLVRYQINPRANWGPLNRAPKE